MLHKKIIFFCSFSALLYHSFLACLKLSNGETLSNIIIVGATGDLSRKYLWQASLYLAQDITSNQSKVKFYGGGRLPFSEGHVLLEQILNDISYKNTNVFKQKFVNSVTYRQLKSRENYYNLCNDIELNVKQSNVRELGRIFYLAVPSFAYVDISKHIVSECRPSNNETWLRVVFEKPFGFDFKSAQDLITKLSENLLDEEIYMIDHYFGKTGVQHILPFRKLNQREYDNNLWNNDLIERVDIVLKETSDVKGRFEYYNKYGVIRDVMQNHMTEIMALLTMELPQNLSSITEIQQRRLHVLKQIETVFENQVVIGQYRSYNKELNFEKRYNQSLTPTFATALLYVNNPRWKGVPFFFLSGKKLDQRISYARVLFKQNSIRGYNYQEPFIYQSKEMIFMFNSNSTPNIFVSTQLPKPNCPYGKVNLINVKNFFGQSSFYSCHPKHNKNAYNVLLPAIYYGQKDLFVNTKELIFLWQIWTDVLTSLENKQPRLYDQPDDTNDENRLIDNLLNIIRINKKLDFASNISDNEIELTKSQNPPNDWTKNVFFRNSSLVTGPLSTLINSLVSDLTKVALEYIQNHGKFHLAFSGGMTPIPLFECLILNAINFPWEQTHIWMVDERCVDFRHNNESNLKLLDDHLLKFLPIPLTNIHPISSELCQQDIYTTYKLGSYIYESELIKYTKQLDFIILGLGTDGHIASLFPYDNVNLESSHTVVNTEKESETHFNKRISLSLKAINQARKRAVLVTGISKHKIISLIKNGVKDVHNLPITGLKLSETTWYIDSNALGS